MELDQPFRKSVYTTHSNRLPRLSREPAMKVLKRCFLPHPTFLDKYKGTEGQGRYREDEGTLVSDDSYRN